MKAHFIPFLILFNLSAFAGTEYTMPINFENTTRDFVVHLPTGFAPGMHLPVVFNMHGYGSNAPQQIFYSRMDLTADANNFICVFPDGLNSSWNSGFAPPYNSYPDDVGFVSKIIDTLSQLYGIDLTRVYACGMSNGGFQSYRMACDLENRIAAIASVTGTLSDLTALNCALSRNIPILEIHGTADPLVDYNGSTGYYAVEQTINFWLNKNLCSTVSDTVWVPDTDTTDSSTVQEIRYRSCNNGTEVWLYKIIGGGHSWPGATIDYVYGPTNRDINASQEIWNFFNRFTLNGAVGTPSIQANKPPTVKIFPNPVNGNCELQITDVSRDNAVNVAVMNTSGQVVWQQNMTTFSSSIQTSQLASGIYFLKAEGKNFTQTLRLIKQ